MRGLSGQRSTPIGSTSNCTSRPFIGGAEAIAAYGPNHPRFHGQDASGGGGLGRSWSSASSSPSAPCSATRRNAVSVAQNVVRSLRQRRQGKDRSERRQNGKLKIGIDIPSPAEIKAIVAALDGRWRPVLLTAIFTGLRASELRGLRWDGR